MNEILMQTIQMPEITVGQFASWMLYLTTGLMLTCYILGRRGKGKLKRQLRAERNENIRLRNVIAEAQQ